MILIDYIAKFSRIRCATYGAHKICQIHHGRMWRVEFWRDFEISAKILNAQKSAKSTTEGRGF